MGQERAPEPESRQRRSFREYRADTAAVFWKTQSPLGSLSNMARGFPVQVGGHTAPSIEALYQALRFPNQPELQRQVLGAPNAWLAKRVARAQDHTTRTDWPRIRVSVMRWCLRLKLGHAPTRFGSVLLGTGDRPIVERSSHDQFWGAVMQEDGHLVGANVLGRLLMELRSDYQRDGAGPLRSVPSPTGIALLLLGECVTSVICRPIGEDSTDPIQTPLFSD